ncbi:uncharacterized protein [Littorina saxatilis]|uniref:uncharacterized protein isoform X1 n=2 Tax=Littorina saxatilis TaxID=31220 RepID=UPI0038B43DBB
METKILAVFILSFFVSIVTHNTQRSMVTTLINVLTSDGVFIKECEQMKRQIQKCPSRKQTITLTCEGLLSDEGAQWVVRTNTSGVTVASFICNAPTLSCSSAHPDFQISRPTATTSVLSITNNHLKWFRNGNVSCSSVKNSSNIYTCDARAKGVEYGGSLTCPREWRVGQKVTLRLTIDRSKWLSLCKTISHRRNAWFKVKRTITSYKWDTVCVVSSITSPGTCQGDFTPGDMTCGCVNSTAESFNLEYNFIMEPQRFGQWSAETLCQRRAKSKAIAFRAAPECFARPGSPSTTRRTTNPTTHAPEPNTTVWTAERNDSLETNTSTNDTEIRAAAASSPEKEEEDLTVAVAVGVTVPAVAGLFAGLCWYLRHSGNALGVLEIIMSGSSLKKKKKRVASDDSDLSETATGGERVKRKKDGSQASDETNLSEATSGGEPVSPQATQDDGASSPSVASTATTPSSASTAYTGSEAMSS